MTPTYMLSLTMAGFLLIACIRCMHWLESSASIHSVHCLLAGLWVVLPGAVTLLANMWIQNL